MRAFIAVVVVGLSLALPASTTAKPDASARAPVLRFVSLAPVKVQGTGFVAQEDVRLALLVRTRTFVRTVRADAFGAFTVGFGLVALEPCRSPAVVRAVGSRGSHASRQRPCRRPPNPAP